MCVFKQRWQTVRNTLTKSWYQKAPTSTPVIDNEFYPPTRIMVIQSVITRVTAYNDDEHTRSCSWMITRLTCMLVPFGTSFQSLHFEHLSTDKELWSRNSSNTFGVKQLQNIKRCLTSAPVNMASLLRWFCTCNSIRAGIRIGMLHRKLRVRGKTFTFRVTVMLADLMQEVLTKMTFMRVSFVSFFSIHSTVLNHNNVIFNIHQISVLFTALFFWSSDDSFSSILCC